MNTERSHQKQFERANKRIGELESKLREVYLMDDVADDSVICDWSCDYSEEIKQLLGDK